MIENTAMPEVVRLDEVLADPTMLQPPLALVPGLVWRGRLSMLAGREKDGKSTFAAAGVAAMTRGHEFLGDPTEEG